MLFSVRGSASHEAIAHVLQLLRNFTRRALQLVRDLFLLGWVQDVEAFAAEGAGEEGGGVW